jgi:hypothetical protein
MLEEPDSLQLMVMVRLMRQLHSPQELFKPRITAYSFGKRQHGEIRHVVIPCLIRLFEPFKYLICVTAKIVTLILVWIIIVLEWRKKRPKIQG